MADAHETLHATAIALGDKAALIRGPSGSGKSDLALRCIMHPPTSFSTTSALLVADDRVVLEKRGPSLIASPPSTLAGLIEVRGLGIYHLEHKSAVPVTLIVDLVPREHIERLPEATARTELLATTLPIIQLCSHDASSAHKVLLALSGIPRHRT